MTDQERREWLKERVLDIEARRISREAHVRAYQARDEKDRVMLSRLKRRLADEFPYGCDSIQYVADALVASRKQICWRSVKDDPPPAWLLVLARTEFVEENQMRLHAITNWRNGTCRDTTSGGPFTEWMEIPK